MKTVSTSLKAHLSQELTSLATCWKVKRRDGAVLGFTDHDQDLSIENVLYEAASGFTPTAIESSAELNVDNLDVEGLLEAQAIKEEDILAGRYDFAEVEVFIVNYADPSMGTMLLRTGWVGEVKVHGKQFVAEVRGLTQQLNSKIGEHYSPGCRANLGDARCGIDLASFTVSGTATSADGQHEFVDSARNEASGYFSFGTVAFTSGANSGLHMEVKEYASGRFSLALPMPYEIVAGDAYQAIAGCDKTFETCVFQFSNAIHFRGEPHVPGTDKVLETSATRSV